MLYFFNLPGIYIAYDTKRSYPYSIMLGQVLGFCGIDGYGLSAIEYLYNEYLESQKGSIEIYTVKNMISLMKHSIMLI